MSYRDNVARLSIPKGIRENDLIRAKDRLHEWLKKLASDKPNLFVPETNGALTGQEITLIGNQYLLKFIPVRSNRITGRRKDGVITVEAPDEFLSDRTQVSDAVPRLINKIFAYDVGQRVRDINRRTIDANIGRVSLKSVVSRWGSCTHENNIMISNRLLLAPIEILDHVIIHELAHTVHRDHSRQFWRVVAQYDSHMKEHNAWLKLHGHTLKY